MIATGISAQAKRMSLVLIFVHGIITAIIRKLVLQPVAYLSSNHLYGYLAGWNYDSDVSRWRWMGNVNINALKIINLASR